MLSRAAEGGDADAQFLVGRRHERGDDVEVDSETATDWYSKAAAQGHAGAQNRLAQRKGIRAQKDKEITQKEREIAQKEKDATEAALVKAEALLEEERAKRRRIEKE